MCYGISNNERFIKMSATWYVPECPSCERNATEDELGIKIFECTECENIRCYKCAEEVYRWPWDDYCLFCSEECYDSAIEKSRNRD